MSGEVLIVGAGLFGQVIASKLREDGHKVTVFDRREPLAGSTPSGGHIKPSWLTGLGKKDLADSLELLNRLYGVQTLECQFKHKSVELLRVDVETVLNAPVSVGDVTQVQDGWLFVVPENNKLLGLSFEGTVIVAAGIWSGGLVPEVAPQLTGKKGMSVTFSGCEPMPNVIAYWAPYKQIVRTSHGPGKIWLGEGSAIVPRNWSADLEGKIEKRLAPYMPAQYGESLVQRGIRPYLTAGEGLRQVSSKLWVATGGGKSGMALAGVYANRLSRALA